jgi:hypothetical protein
MSKTITIALPEKLFDRLKDVKGMFNVSGICQDALEREIGIQEILAEGVDGRESIIAKFKEQKKAFSEQYRGQGRKDGINDASKMDYVQLTDLVNKQFQYQNNPQADDLDPNIVYDSEFFRNGQTWLTKRLKGHFNKDTRFDQDAYLTGWIEGICDFWDNIKDSI